MLLLATGFIARAQEGGSAFSLEQAIQYGQKNNTQAKNAGLDVEVAKKKIWETTAMGLPQISGEVSYQNFIDIPTSVAPAEAFGGPAGEFVDLQFGTTNNASAGITLSQLIFNGTYIVGLQAAKTYAKFADEQKLKADADVRNLVQTSYYQALQAKASQKALEENLATVSRLLSDIKAMHENGFLEDLDVEVMTLQEAQLQNAVAKSKELSTVTTDLLKMQMGYPADQGIELTDDLVALAEQASTENLAGEAFDMNNNPDYKMATSGEALTALNLKKEKFSRYPSMAGFISHSQNAYRNDFSFFSSEGKWYPTTVAGFKIEIPIFDSRGQASRIGQAKLELEKVSNNKQLLADNLRMEYVSAKASMDVAVAAFKTAKSNTELSDKILKKMTIKQKEGMATSMELTQAQNQQINTQISYYAAAADLLLAKARLQKVLNK
ncbi:MAG: TolC family protein [Flavobacteriales bacterium]|nr:TolC family protein [Flavobacteriales bacterium]